jgi:uncharacterized protein YebE (UPF0316 family)
MDSLSFLDSNLYTWVILPALIFLARVCDVSLGTVRIIFISRGMKYFAALVGICEILIWLLAIGQIFKNLNNIICYIAYAGGFASGSFLGIYIAEKLSLGKVVIQIITPRSAAQLIEFLKTENYGVTTIPAQGVEGPVEVVFSIIERQDLKRVVSMVKQFNPQAFYTIEDVRFASEGIFPERASLLNQGTMMLLRPHRKST